MNDQEYKSNTTDEKEGTADDSSFVNGILNYATHTINKADARKAADHVAKMRRTHPNLTDDELAQLLIRDKAAKSGSVGAATAGTGLIPGLGTLTAMTLGVAADMQMTYRLQAELVLELAQVYNYPLSEAETRTAIMMTTGVSMGANRILSRASREATERISARIVGKSVTKAIPLLGLGASAATNSLSTYVVGKRAQAYFKLGPDAVGSWMESLRALSGVDERTIAGTVRDVMAESWRVLNDSAAPAALSVGRFVGRGLGRAGALALGAGSSGVSKAAQLLSKKPNNDTEA